MARVVKAVAEESNLTAAQHAQITLRYVRERSDKVILFYSGGKDSIVLLDMLSFFFSEIHCVFMYFVKDMEHQRPLLAYLLKYGEKVILHQYPHWMLTHYFRHGYYRFHQPEDNFKLLRLSDIENNIKSVTGIKWVVNGAKQSDSMHRQLMLRNLYFRSINLKTGRVFPLSLWSKQDVLSYIRINRLPMPEQYEAGKSNGLDLTPPVLKYLKTNWPGDYKKILEVFPFAGVITNNNEQELIEIPEI